MEEHGSARALVVVEGSWGRMSTGFRCVWGGSGKRGTRPAPGQQRGGAGKVEGTGAIYLFERRVEFIWGSYYTPLIWCGHIHHMYLVKM